VLDSPFTRIILCIQSQNNGFSFDVTVDGQPVAVQRILPSCSVSLLANRYAILLAGSVEPDGYAALGTALFDLWLQEDWGQIDQRSPVGVPRQLIIASESSAVLNLPWELLKPPGSDFLGLDQLFSVLRTPWHDRHLAKAGPLRPRPLRVLFMACAPLDQPELDYEREEELLVEAVSDLDVRLETCDMGTFDELRDRINQFRPHIVHLSGHGALGEDGMGWFAFEDETGHSDFRSAVKISGLLSGSGAQCAFTNGCESAAAPPVAAVGGICQELVNKEVPLAIGWAAPIADDLAIAFAREFYRTVAAGQRVDLALTQARNAIFEACEARG